MTKARSGESTPGDGLLHPVPLVALAVLALNDHWWKRAYPSFLTGKLSDIAGLVFFPLLLQALWESVKALVTPAWGPSRTALLASALATAVVFGLAKTWEPMSELVRLGDAALRSAPRLVLAIAQGLPAPPLGRSSLLRDPTDLLALPAVLVALRVGSLRKRPT